MRRKIIIEFLKKMLAIKSYEPSEKIKCANLIAEKLRSLNFDVEVISGFESPIVVGYLNTGSQTDILFYSHYDVKPEGDRQNWNTDPFVPYFDNIDNKVYARGAGDDKGQIFAVILGIESVFKRGEHFSHNITILIEGDEESGSPGIEEFCRQHMNEKLYSAIIINDSHWLHNKPVIYCGNRGQLSINLSYCIESMEENLHAGNYGGIFNGAAREFLAIVTNILSEIDDIYNHVTTTREFGNAVSLTHISSGETNRSTIPKKAVAKLDIRFIDGDIPEKIKNIMEKYAGRYHLEYKISQLEECFYNEPNYEFLDELCSIIHEITNYKPFVQKYCGAYLPLNKLSNIKGNKYVIPLAQSDEHNHSSNENISITHIYYGMMITNRIVTMGKKSQSCRK